MTPVPPITEVVNNVVIVREVVAKVAVNVVNVVDVEVAVDAATFVTNWNALLCSVNMPVELIEVVLSDETVAVDVVVVVPVELVSIEVATKVVVVAVVLGTSK